MASRVFICKQARQRRSGLSEKTQYEVTEEIKMYEYKEVCVLDFRNVKYYQEIHDVIRKELDFPD